MVEEGADSRHTPPRIKSPRGGGGGWDICGCLENPVRISARRKLFVKAALTKGRDEADGGR